MAPGPASMGIPERHNARIFFGCSLFLVAVGLLGGRTLGLQHVQTNEHQDQAAGDLECRQLDAEHLEDVLAGERETASNDEAGDRTLARNPLAAFGVRALGDGKE